MDVEDQRMGPSSHEPLNQQQRTHYYSGQRMKNLQHADQNLQHKNIILVRRGKPLSSYMEPDS